MKITERVEGALRLRRDRGGWNRKLKEQMERDRVGKRATAVYV